MTKPRRQYSPEYKQEAVGLVRQSGQPISHIAKNLGIHDSLLRRWIKEHPNPAKKSFPGQGNPGDEEVAHLRREFLEVKRERDFLPKGHHVREAAAYFARELK